MSQKKTGVHGVQLGAVRWCDVFNNKLGKKRRVANLRTTSGKRVPPNE